MRTLLTTCLFAAAVGAQTLVTVPDAPSIQNQVQPMAQGVGRYQQWYNPQSPGFAAITEPMRIQEIQFLAGTGNGAAPQPASATVEVLIGHGKGSFFGIFDNNWDEPPVTVVATSVQNITANPVGAPAMTLPFSTFFTWDNVRPIVVEVRVYGNNQGNGPFPFQFAGTTLANGQTRRCYAANNVGATSGSVTADSGLITIFNARPGIMLPFGDGCPGEGNVVPQNSANEIASPAITWTHNLTAAASQRTAFWVIGDTRTAPFPVDLAALLGAGSSPCNLLTNPANAIPVVTVGGGAGSGVATLPVQLPPTTGYVGLSIYTQWVVFDPLSISGLVSVSPGLWTIVAPLGG
ncbi:MAG: hypothetical protein AB8H80_10955 [Planctomycetota bacterium]